MSENKYISYKGFPLVRKDDIIYYGNMYDPYVIMIQVNEKKSNKGLDIGTKLGVYLLSTDENLSPIKAIIKRCDRNSLYEALDIAYVWLSRILEKAQQPVEAEAN